MKRLFSFLKKYLPPTLALLLMLPFLFLLLLILLVLFAPGNWNEMGVSLIQQL